MSMADRILAASKTAAKKTPAKKAAAKKTAAKKTTAKKKRSSKPGSRRPHRLTIDLSGDEAETLRSTARAERVTVADLVRGVATILGGDDDATRQAIIEAAIRAHTVDDREDRGRAR